MNDFYNAPETPVDFTIARASQVRAQFAAVAAAFDKLPGQHSLFQGLFNYAVAGGTPTALTANMPLPPPSYEEGALFRLKMTQDIGENPTLNIDGLGAKPIVDSEGDSLAVGTLDAGDIHEFVYLDNTFVLAAVSGPAGPPGPQGPAGGPQGDQGEQGPQGDQGEQGERGYSVLNGVVNPTGGVGVDGDFYINKTSWQIFGPKALGAWGSGTNLIGPQGPQGIQGAQGPAGTAGAYSGLSGIPAAIDAIDGLTPAADRVAYYTGASTAALATLTAFGRSLIAAANASAANALLGGLGSPARSLANPGYVKLDVGGSSPLILQWGNGVGPSSEGSGSVTYPTPFSTFSVAVMSGQRSTNSTEAGAVVTGCGTTSFTYYWTNRASGPFFWIAVGV